VLFLDPFGTQVKWSTVEKIAIYEAFDTWILFPVSAIARMLPRTRKPDDIDVGWSVRLTEVFGNDSWRGQYQESRQLSLFGKPGFQRKPGVDRLCDIYKARLVSAFGSRFLQDSSRTPKNSTNSPLFEFMFCVGNPSGIEPAKKLHNTS